MDRKFAKSKLEELENIIATKVFVLNSEEQISLSEDPNQWLFDFRRVLMNGEVSELISELFYESYKDRYPFQLCSLEIAGVPLMVSIMRKFYEKGHRDINAFFIRKSRKKTGLMRMVEGTILETKDVILVDDIMNTGDSFWRQVDILEQLGHQIKSVWSILCFRDLDYYMRFKNRGIEVNSLFTLDDFSGLIALPIKNLVKTELKSLPMPFTTEWVFQSEKPTLGQVLPKSQPIIDEKKIYFGSDNRTFWAINQSDGSIAWQYKVGLSVKKKSIFSNPVLYEDFVIFGSYDGNLYALDKETGRRKWVAMEADWIGSSPAVATELGLVFVGLEFGLFRRHGGIAAFSASTGKLVWKDEHPAFTHASPLYIEEHQQVVVGSNDGKVRMYDAISGKKIWTFTTFGGATFDSANNYGFSSGDIKECCAYYSQEDYLLFGSIDDFFYILDRRTGRLVQHFKCDSGIFSSPYVYGDKAYFTSTDRCVRCVDLNTLEIVFSVNLDGSRIFSTPTVVNNMLYVGTNAGRLHELNPNSGERLGYLQIPERITNTVVHNSETDYYFLPTYANEIVKLKRKLNT